MWTPKHKITTCSACIILLTCTQGSAITEGDGKGAEQEDEQKTCYELVSLKNVKGYINSIMAMPA